jgi:hypothetical protein
VGLVEGAVNVDVFSACQRYYIYKRMGNSITDVGKYNDIIICELAQIHTYIISSLG